MFTSLKSYVHSLLAFKPILLGLSIFAFIWVCWLRLENQWIIEGGLHLPVWPYHEDVASLLVVASFVLILNKRWGSVLAGLMGVTAVYITLFYDFLDECADG